MALETTLQRLAHRSDDEIAAARRRILEVSPAPHSIPEGETLASVVAGHWPGDETDEEIKAALRKLS